MRIYRALNIEENEVKVVTLLLMQSIFLGFFFSAFDISASSLFLKYYEATSLPKAFLISGLTGMVLTFIYSKLQERISFGTLAILNLIFISAITTVVRLGFDFFDIELFVFIALVFMGPLNILAIVGFGGIVGRMFTLRQGKRLFGVIDSGYILGIIIGSYVIPLILQFNFQNKNLLFISAFSIIIALIIQFFISSLYKPELSSEDKKSVEKVSLTILYKNPYIRFMAIFVILSMVTAFFINYSFLSVVKMQYPDSTNLATFLGFFNGTMMIFIILLKTFVYSKLVKTYGLQVALMLSPILLGIFTIAASLIGTFSGYTAAAANFGLFFLVIALSRLFSKAMKDSMEMPSFKLLYQSLDNRIRYDVQAKIDGTVNEFSAVFAGLLLVILSSFPFIKLIHFSIILVIGLAIWVFLGRRLYQQYRTSLSENLKKTLTKHEEIDEHNVSEKIIHQINQEKEDSKISNLLRILNDTKPIDYQNYILQLLDDSKHPLHKTAFKASFNSSLLFDDQLIKLMEQDKTLNNEEGFQEIIQTSKKYIKSIDNKTLLSLVNSKKTEDRLHAALNIQYHKNTEHLSFLKKLLRDYEEEVEKQAIIAAASIYDDDILSILIDFLNDDDLFPFATNALEFIGKDCLNALYQSYFKRDIQDSTLLRITKIIGKIEGKESTDILVHLIDSKNIDIKQNSLYYLSSKKYQTEEKKRHGIFQEIRDLAGVISWNIAAKTTIQEKRMGEDLLKAIDEELDANFGLLFHFLSIIYNPQSIEQVRDNLETGTTEGIGYALELLDIFIDEEIKNILFPILEDTSDNEKINILSNFYPVRKFDEKELTNRLLSRDLNYINNWTKACALSAIEPEEYDDMPEEVLAHIFNPDPMIQELAAYKTCLIAPEKYESCSNRLHENIKEHLDIILQSIPEQTYVTHFERTRALKKLDLFSNLPGKQIYRISRNLITLNQDNIDENLFSDYVFLAACRGTLEVRRNNEKFMELDEGNYYFSMEGNHGGDKYNLHMSTNVLILAMNIRILKSIIADHYKLSGAIIKDSAVS